MNHTIKNIIPTLRQFAQKIEFKNAIVGKIWVLPEEDNVIHDYEFTSDGKLYISINGNIQVGKWEILPTGRIVIDRVVDKIMLNFDFALDGIVVMKKTGNDEMPFLLYNKELIPDGNVLSYIDSKYIYPQIIDIKGDGINLNEPALNSNDIQFLFFVCFLLLILGLFL
jgi:hypothetical protein